MRYTVGLIAGVALFVLGVQGGIRLLADHGDAGLLAWIPGGFTLRLAGYAAVIIVGALVAAWAGPRAKRATK